MGRTIGYPTLRVGTLLMGFWMALAATIVHAEPARPNIIWITSEDNGPHLGCYGDRYADSPNIDRIAERGTVYLNCWSNAPVCAPARTTLISGIFPPSTGSQHMRSMTQLPDDFHMYPYYLRQAGYYCTNSSKEDYNLAKVGDVWHDSSRKAHWKNREADQPFFAVFNFTVSHESQIRKRPHKKVHDPAKVRVPAYHPDVPEVRQDWAQYYDKITEMDKQVGQVLDELQEAGLMDDTIIFYYGDHGSGMPRSKRWPYNSGLNVPLVISIPPKFKAMASADYESGGKSDRLVSFVDLAPTALSLAGVKPPQQMQGYAFLGPHQTKEQPYIYGFRGRMDERYDMVRVVRDKQYIYIRNYMPHKVYGQFIAYMFKTPTTHIWKEMYDAGKLNEAQSRFWEQKPSEELYDLSTDTDEVHNLAGSADHQEILERLRKANAEHLMSIRDLGFLPEGEIHWRSEGSSPYEYGHSDDYDLKQIMQTAELASRIEDHSEDSVRQLASSLQNDDSAVRFWAAMGLFIRGEVGVKLAKEALMKATKDKSDYVKILACQSLAQFGTADQAPEYASELVRLADVSKQSVFTAMWALNALDELDERAATEQEKIAKLPRQPAKSVSRMRSYVPNLITKTLADLK